MTDLRLGDCVEVLAGLEPGCVDAVVCDPPYGLGFMGKEWDSAAALASRPPSATRDTPLGRFDLGKGPEAVKFDARGFQAWCETWAREVFRVLKPGGHLLAFGGTRTYHRLACAVEDAGFEIRDTICWLYGSGFPKSRDVSKAIDAKNGRTNADQHRLAAHIRERRTALGLSRQEVNAWFGYVDGCEHWERTDASGARVPTLADWRVLREQLGLSDEHLPLVERVEAEREKVGEDRNWGAPSESTPNAPNGVWDITAPATDDARRWQGWGTALKPAHEPIVVARKPLVGTVAGNVLEHGVGALNVDGCRIDTGDEVISTPQSDPAARVGTVGQAHTYSRIDREDLNARQRAASERANAMGRWPANVVMDETAAAMLDEQTGELPAGTNVAKGTDPDRLIGKGIHGSTVGGRGHLGFGDSGGASRFFYVAKASRAERNAGLDGFDAKNLAGHNKWTDVDYRRGDGEVTAEPQRNHHPTVKPIALMRWLVRLVTPPGGLVLDPFLGSGTTGIAAALEGLRFLGIERDPDYLEIARARIGFWQEHGEDGLRIVAEREAAETARAVIAESGQLDILDLLAEGATA